jgi:phosphoadenosine phosphosulfate reductase
MENRVQVYDELSLILEGKSANEVLHYFFNEFDGNVGFSTSLGAEDQVITHMLSQITSNPYIFTLDTGRLFPETYDLLDLTTKKYNLKINIFYPQAESVQKMVTEKGINLFYDSIENRELCCFVRKMEPLKRAFTGLDVWVCGLRKGQSPTRKDMKNIEWDEKNGLIKVNPIIDWTEQQVWNYIRENKVPYNKLHDKGFPSIGCQPCTRAVQPGEDIRAGRWWWENPETRECGLHKK